MNIMKKALRLVIFAEFFIITLIFFSTTKDEKISFKERCLSIFCAPFPASEPKMEHYESWEGYSFEEGLRIFHRNADDPFQLLEDLVKYNFNGNKYGKEYVTLGDSGVIVFIPLRKGYTAIALIVIDSIITWTDITSRESSLDSKFQYFGFFLNNLNVYGEKASGGAFLSEFKAFREKIPILHMQDPKNFLLLIIGVILIVDLFIFILIFVGGSPPENPEPDWEIITPHVMIYEKLPFGNKSYSACLIKKGDEILIYSFKRKKKVIEIEKDLHFKGKNLHIGKSTKIAFPDDETLKKWKALLA